jgi:hypothetical protein
MTVWRGGAGVKAPYETTHVRIPSAIKEQVEQLSKAYKERVLQGEEQATLPDGDQLMSFDEAVEISRKILRRKKSAKVSLESLLTSLYKREVCL